ncbi:hypothetical protein [Streptomyces incarnatus]|uniref:hypothetical protein n=1 Tax=Streptomyces incarnatus TaxID=665007 RepID=UPI000B299429
MTTGHAQSTRAAAHYREPTAHHVPERVDTSVDRILVDVRTRSCSASSGGRRHRPAAPAPTRRACTARFAPHLTVRGGPVVRDHVYEDGLAAARACAPSGESVRPP